MTGSERMENAHPWKVYQIRETRFDELACFAKKYMSEQQIYKILAIFDFDSICVQDETFEGTITATRIEKHVPIFLSFSSKPVEEPCFLCNSHLHHLVASSNGTLEN